MRVPQLRKIGLPAMTPRYTRQPWAESYSEIIDVRSPREFAEDRIPSSINLPVLNDSDRTGLGTIYKQISPLTVRKIKAALVSKNISQHLIEYFATKDKNYRPLVYCGRGGQRSSSMALALAQIGWRVTLLEGGYKTYRADVRKHLEHLPDRFTYQVLCGLTGSAKKRILHQMRQRGAQVLDLAALANHSDSLLGEEWQGEVSLQPSQKYFESLLIEQLQKFNPHQPVWVESLSQKIGKVYLPQSLWEKMKQASCVEIQIPIAAIDFVLEEYSHLINDADVLKWKLEKLKSRCGWDKLCQWHQLIDAQEWELFMQDMLQFHHDYIYRQSRKHYYNKVERVLSLPNLSDSNMENLLACLLQNCVALI